MVRPQGHGPGYESRRQEIIDSSVVLFAKQGYAATGVADIATKVGLGKGALYHYIGSKESILIAIQDRVLSPLLTEADRIRILPESALTRLRLISEQLLQVIYERLEHIWIYEHDYRNLSKKNRKRVLDQRHRFEAVITELLQEAISSGDIEDADSRLLMLQFLNMHNYTYQWIHPATSPVPSELSSTYFKTLMKGFGASSTSINQAEKAAKARENRVSTNHKN